MSAYAYAVVGRQGSGHEAVALDLAGGFVAGGKDTVLVELAPGPPYLLDLLDLDPSFVFRSTAREALSNPGDPADAATPVAVEAAGVDSLGVVPADPDGDGESLSLDGLEEVVESLARSYEVVVLAVGADCVGDLGPLATALDGCVATAGTDPEEVRAASRLTDRLADRDVPLGGIVVTDCAHESDLWTATAGLDGSVVGVVPPVRPDRVEAVGNRIRTVRNELADAGGTVSGGPDLDADRPVRSLAALVEGDPGRASVVDDDAADDDVTDDDVADDAASELDEADRTTGESDDGSREDSGGSDGDAESTFRFGELPPAEDGSQGDHPSGEGSPDESPDGNGPPDDRSSDDGSPDDRASADGGEGSGRSVTGLARRVASVLDRSDAPEDSGEGGPAGTADGGERGDGHAGGEGEEAASDDAGANDDDGAASDEVPSADDETGTGPVDEPSDHHAGETGRNR